MFFEIRGTNGGMLELGPPDPDVFEAKLRAKDIAATVPVFHYGGDGLDRFFADLARDWRGWKGMRTWKSLEDALGFSASMSRTGVVTLQIEMRNSAVFKWRLIYDITIENGQLDQLAVDARRFTQSLGTVQGLN